MPSQGIYLARANTSSNAALVSGIPVATVAWAVFLAMTAPSKGADERIPIFKDRCELA